MTASLGTRIVVGTVLSTALIVAVASAFAWVTTRRMLYDSLDAKLRDRVHSYASRGVPLQLLMLQQREGPPPPEAGPSASWTMTQVANADTRAEIARSSSLPAEISLISLLPPGPPEPTVRAVTLPDGRALRLLSIVATARPWSEHGHRWHEGGHDPAHDAESPPEPPPSPPQTTAPLLVAVALDATATEDELRRLARILEALCGGAVALAVAVSAGLRRAILRPVARVSDGIRAMDPSNLSARIPAERAPHELESVLQRLNELLGRVEQSVQRERATIANIAHELRTPVAGLMTTLEFALAEEPEGSAREVHQRCLTAVAQMRGMIATLLALARLEAGQETWTPQSVDAAALLRECWEPVRAESERRGQTVDWIGPTEAVVRSSPEKLRVIVANLLGNAVDHAPDGARVRIEARLEGDLLAVTIANPMRIPLASVADVFTPFWRGDPSRTGAHCGLGLTLVQRLVRLLGGTVTPAIEDGLFIIRLAIPSR